MKLAVPFGFYGAGNIGDESTLQGFARLVSRDHDGMRVWVASRNPSHTARVEPSFKYYKSVGRDPRKWWAQYRSDAYVFAGGTPIMDILGSWPLSEVAPLISAAHSQGKPVAFVGTGTERLQEPESKRTLSDILAPKVAHWSVRCERDKERLITYGVSPERVTVASDLAWMLDPVTNDFGKQHLKRLGLADNESYVGVNVNNEVFMLKQEPRLFEKLGQFFDALVKQHGVRVLFLCNEVREDDMFDKAASIKILASMKHKELAFLVPNEYLTPQQMQSLIACCRATVSTRYHFCLFSALQKVPFVALKRSDKVDDLCWDMDWPYGVSLTGLSVPALLDMFSEIEQRRASLIECLQQRTQLMRERALRNSVPVDTLVNGAGK